MNADIERQIQEAIPAIQARPNILAFSCGADSVASYLRLREWGIKPTLVYMEYVPDIPMVDAYIKYFEKRFDVAIHRVLGPLGCVALGNGLYQRPGIGAKMFKASPLSRGTRDAINAAVLNAVPDSILSVGIRYTDGFGRFRTLSTLGPFRKNEFDPIGSFLRSEVHDIIEKADCPLPYDYRILGRSFESLRHSVAVQLRDHAPASWAHLCGYFPMAPLLCAQASLIPTRRDLAIRIKAFQDLAFRTELAP